MYLKEEVFEKLLFSLNKNIYQKVEEKIHECLVFDKYFIDKSIFIFEKQHNIVAFEQTNLEQDRKYRKLYAATIVVNIFSDDYRINMLEKADYEVGFDPNNTGWKMPNNFPGNTLVVNIRNINDLQSINIKRRIDSYKIPLEYVLGYKNSDILNENSYQLYLHTVTPKNEYYNENYLRDNARLYVGITKRSWQTVRRDRRHRTHVCIETSYTLNR